MQKQSPGALQQHVEGYRRLARTLSESRGERSRQTGLVRSTGLFDVLCVATTHQGSRRAIPRKHALPVGFGGGVIEFSQPLDVVAIRARQGEIGVPVAQEGLIECKYLLPKQKPRAPVEKTVMSRPQHPMLALCRAH